MPARSNQQQQQLLLHQQQQHYARSLSRATASHIRHQQQLMQQHLASSYAPFNYSGPTLVARKESSHQTKPAAQQKGSSRPLCRCRVMYLGSSVPHVTKNGLHGIQEPLHHLYPEERFTTASSAPQQKPPVPSGDAAIQQQQQQTIDISHLSSGLGIDSWLSVWSNGLLLENTDDLGRQVRRFFSIESLHYCAAVRFFDTGQLEPLAAHHQHDTNYPPATGHNSAWPPPADHNNNSLPAAPARAPLEGPRGRFLPLDAPIFRWPSMLDASHPPVFAAIFRRTSGVKVLECHAFICRRDAAANALVRCCTHAYGDLLNARRLSVEMPLAAVEPPAPPPCSVSKWKPASRHLETPVSEDNYAVICTQQTNGRPTNGCSPTCATPEPQRRHKSTSPVHSTSGSEKRKPRHDQHRHRARKGSSRSLFPDFSPEPQHPAPDAAAEQATANTTTPPTTVQRLSQSLERFQLDGEPTCCPVAHPHNKPTERHCSTATARPAQEGPNKDRRLSKSMQNLQQPSSCTTHHKPVQCGDHYGSGSISRAKRSSHHRKRQPPGASNRKLKRRAASVHELQCQPLTERAPPPPQGAGLTKILDETEDRLSSSRTTAGPVPELGSANHPLSGTKPHDGSAVPPGSGLRQERRQRRARAAPLPPLPNLQHQQYLMMGPHPHPPPHLYPLMRACYGAPPVAASAAGYGLAAAGYAMPPPPHHLLDPSAATSLILAQTPQLLLQHQHQHQHQQPVYGPARFRCLSPPAALLGPSQQWTGGQSSPLAAGQVVGGEPGFAARRHQDKPSKLSWIKRLSLTISAAGPSSGGLPGEQQQHSTGSQPRRRRSSLFTLTGTLGRRGPANTAAAAAATACEG